MSDYAKLPFNPSFPVEPFRPSAPQDLLDSLKAFLAAPPPIRGTYESLGNAKEHVGVTKEWMEGALEAWKELDWRKVEEEEIGGVPNFFAKVSTDSGEDKDVGVHFAGLLSEKKDAIPIILIHGWPGSFLEFLPLLRHVKSKYSPKDLPYHLIVPSLPGFGYSDPPPTDRDWCNRDTARVFDGLMRGLGFEKYVAQGGDIGSAVARLIGEKHEACAAVHLNFIPRPNLDGTDESNLDDFDKACVERWKFFSDWEFAYRNEHATKTSTIGMLVGSSPFALLAWIGEKFLVWTDPTGTPSLHTILSDITLYWVTSTFPTSLYHYRTSYSTHKNPANIPSRIEKGKPVGYSQFRYEILPTPLSWTTVGDIVFHKRHDRGGHFAALERPVDLWQDVDEFIQQVWK